MAKIPTHSPVCLSDSQRHERAALQWLVLTRGIYLKWRAQNHVGMLSVRGAHALGSTGCRVCLSVRGWDCCGSSPGPIRFKVRSPHSTELHQGRCQVDISLWNLLPLTGKFLLTAWNTLNCAVLLCLAWTFLGCYTLLLWTRSVFVKEKRLCRVNILKRRETPYQKNTNSQSRVKERKELLEPKVFLHASGLVRLFFLLLFYYVVLLGL